MAALVLLDLLLALGATLRLTRFIVADDVPGTWWIKWPLDRLKHRSMQRNTVTIPETYVGGIRVPSRTRQEEPGWARYLEGLSCPYCISVYMAGAVTLALVLAGGAGDAADWWRYVAGFLTLAWLTGHIAARVGDTEE